MIVPPSDVPLLLILTSPVAITAIARTATTAMLVDLFTLAILSHSYWFGFSSVQTLDLVHLGLHLPVN